VSGIPFYIWGMAEEFTDGVIDDFLSEYAAGRTPNPCLRCNEKIKFAAVLAKAKALGFDAVATGHHARLVGGVLRRSVDLPKDQSYVLAVLRPDQLAGAMFPLGNITKEQVRAEAAARKITVAKKPDSHDICFIPDGDTQGFLRKRLGERPGDIVDPNGDVIGAHTGTYNFTVGQRKGLGIGHPAPDGRPRYVLSIEPVSNTVTVGSREELAASEIIAIRPLWLQAAPAGPMRCQAQLRAHGEVYDATAELIGDELRVNLDSTADGVAPGQAVVLYQPDTEGDVVIGSATISHAR
ncbi:MAG: tRNA 2-thiouridine(34) synthase MnmA, partial [Corynebacteriales bacterium]|nr:tRNA 2-thiouridine(34) synthase MnmA [Mycobacteriales bacterium]